MTDKQLKTKILTQSLLADAYIAMEAKIERAITCDALNIEDWDSEKNNLRIPKTIVAALLEDEIHNWDGNRTTMAKAIKKDIRNLRKIM